PLPTALPAFRAPTALRAPNARAAVLYGALLLVGCSSAGGSTPTPAPAGAPYATLEEWHLFADARAQTPAGGVVPYDVAATLFADYTGKLRFLWIPPGKKIGWKDTDRWS